MPSFETLIGLDRAKEPAKPIVPLDQLYFMHRGGRRGKRETAHLCAFHAYKSAIESGNDLIKRCVGDDAEIEVLHNAGIIPSRATDVTYKFAGQPEYFAIIHPDSRPSESRSIGQLLSDADRKLLEALREETKTDDD